MSRDRWEKLDEMDRGLIRQFARASVRHLRSLWDEEVEASRQRLDAVGIEVNEVEDVGEFQRAMAPVWDQFIITDEQRALVAEIQRLGGENEEVQ